MSIKGNAQQLYFQSKAMLKHSDDIVFDRLAWLHHRRLTEWKVTCGQTEQTHRMAVNTTNDRRSRRNTHTHILHQCQAPYYLRGSKMKNFTLLFLQELLWSGKKNQTKWRAAIYWCSEEFLLHDVWFGFSSSVSWCLKIRACQGRSWPQSPVR